MEDDDDLERVLREFGLWSPVPESDEDEEDEIPSLDDIAADEEGPRRNYGWQDEWGDWQND